MLLSLLAAAAVQAAIAEPPKLTAPPKPAIRALSCQQIPVPILTPTGSTGRPALHTLAQEPDAAMLRPVLRIAHCNDEDVLRLNVSSNPSPSTGQNAPQQRGR